MPSYDVGGKVIEAPTWEEAMRLASSVSVGDWVRVGNDTALVRTVNADGSGTAIGSDGETVSFPAGAQRVVGAGSSFGRGSAPAQQGPKGSPPLSRAELLQSVINGDITLQEANDELTKRGETKLQYGIDLPGPSSNGNSTTAGEISANSVLPPVPTASNFRSRLNEAIGASDFLRQEVLGRGISPLFRGAAEDVISRQELPFALSQAQAGNVLDEPGQAQTAFREFINRQGLGAVSRVGPVLQQAGEFLRNPRGPGGILSEGQEAFLPWLVNTNSQGQPVGVGSELFNPTIGLLTQRPSAGFMPGLGAGGRQGVANFLRNYLAQNPTQFQSPSDFIDFLSTRGLLR